MSGSAARPRSKSWMPASTRVQWAGVLALSCILFAALEAVRMPASALLGPMIAGLFAATNGASARVPKSLFAAAQGIIAVMIASSINLQLLATFAEEWPIFLLCVLTGIAASTYLGWQISRMGVLPGSTAIWGLSPGGATIMILMAAAFGADPRLVAFMQYLRVTIVAMVTTGVVLLVGEAGKAPGRLVFQPVDWPLFGFSIAVVLAGGILGRAARLPTPYMLGPMIFAIILHLGGGFELQFPPLVLIAAYALIGWSIGLNFTREIVGSAVRALPQVLVSIFLLLLFCAGIGFLLSEILGIDLLTAYLATSPAGMDVIAIIASSANVNITFVMAMHMARFLIVLLFGPLIARMLASRLVNNEGAD